MKVIKYEGGPLSLIAGGIQFTRGEAQEVQDDAMADSILTGCDLFSEVEED